MKAEKLFPVSNYLLITLSLLPLLLSDKFALADALVVTGVLALCALLEFKGKIPHFSAASGYFKYLLIAAIVMLMFSQQDKYLLLVWLTMLFLLSKIILKKDFTDHLLVYVLTLLLLLFGAVVVVEFYFSLIFLAYFFTITWCLLFYHLVHERMEEEKALASSSERRLHAEKAQEETVAESFFWSVNGIITISLLFTLVVYFVFPRLSSGFLKFDVGDAGLFTGFSDEVALGEIGTINEDAGVAFRSEIYYGNKKVRLDVPRIYWWGKSLDHYENNRWSDTTKERIPLRKIGYGSFATNTKREGRIYTGKFSVQPFHSNVLFFPFLPLRVDIRERSLYTPRGDGLNLERYEYKSLDYTLTFSLSRGQGNFPYVLPKGYLSDKMLQEKYLNIVEDDAQIKSLAEDVTKGAITPVEKGKALEDYFLRNFSYTLQYGDRKGMSPLHYFLFESKAGHCEYFATAMALMLRDIGIPARIVNGFAGGEWSSLGEYYIVRKRNAHTWVELYHEGKWYPFDPTPGVFTVESGSSFRDRFSTYLDFAKLKWNQYFILYSWQDQMKVGLKLDNQGAALRELLKGFVLTGYRKARDLFASIGFGEGREWMVLLILSGGGILLLFLSRGIMGRLDSGKDPAKRASHALIEKLRKLGIEKLREETFYECYRRNTEKIDAEKGLWEEIEQYYRLRFGRF